MNKLRWCFFSFCFATSHVYASGTDALKAFLQNTQSGKSHFEQTVTDKNNKILQQASGDMQFARPGKFRWEYAAPYAQNIVGDGAKLWIYDQDLNQVTVRGLHQALGNSPAALLAGSNALERDYALKDLGVQDGLDWVEALPKAKDISFSRVRIGFSNAGILSAMELHDAFGQTTVIRFSMFERNPQIAPSVFHFAPPQGADVISD